MTAGKRSARVLAALLLGCAAWLLSTGALAQETPEDPLEAMDEDASLDDEDFEDLDEYAVPVVNDPFEGFNRAMFKFNNTAVKYALRPIANGYETVVPPLGRRGLSSFFTNLRFPVRFVGCLLQGKVDRGLKEVAKFVVNTTVGVGGFFDIAGQDPGLQVPSEDIGQAFGRWGIGHGPYLVLPFLGPSSARELAGSFGDAMLSPVNRRLARGLEWEWGLAYLTTNTLRELPDRLRTFEELQRMSVDPYIAMRNGYLQYRDNEVKR
ncbi:MAG: VacJ family lipoprotein [Verrucomicrobia bacterium]|nr:MAG: VacJ family lipoprotein [Verrucomicrobiota bacterium]